MIYKINPYVEIIFFMEKDDYNLKKFLNSLGISRIFIDKEKTVEQIVECICNDFKEKDLNLEIEKLKKIIEINSLRKNQGFKFINKLKRENNNLNKIIAFSGYYGSGKSLITSMCGIAARKLNVKTIIIDFDIINNSINTLFKVSKYNKKYKVITDISQCIITIKDKLDLFCGIDLLFNEENKISFESVKELFEELKKKYELILVDTSSETKLKYISTVLLNVDKIIYLMEPNLLEIKKAESLIEIYIEDWGIPSYKFNILLNKVNINSIDEMVIKELFSKFKIIGKVDFSCQYNSFINSSSVKESGINKYIKILEKV